jgi:hypothetical protein
LHFAAIFITAVEIKKFTIMQIHNQISNLLLNIQKHWERSNSNNNRITRIDRDILAYDLRKLYDLIFELKVAETTHEKMDETTAINVNLSSMKASQEKNEDAEPKPDKPEELIHKKEISCQKPQQNPGEIELEVVNIPEENSRINDKNNAKVGASAEVSETITIEKEFAISTETKKVEVQSREVKLSTSDKFAAPKTFADVYAKNGDNSLAAKIQKNNLSDIKTAIGINDRFLFINTIFNGDANAYTEAIRQFNGAKTYPEALHLFDEIKQKYKLKDEPALSRLMEIVVRKF